MVCFRVQGSVGINGTRTLDFKTYHRHVSVALFVRNILLVALFSCPSPDSLSPCGAASLYVRLFLNALVTSNSSFESFSVDSVPVQL